MPRWTLLRPLLHPGISYESSVALVAPSEAVRTVAREEGEGGGGANMFPRSYCTEPRTRPTTPPLPHPPTLPPIPSHCHPSLTLRPPPSPRQGHATLPHPNPPPPPQTATLPPLTTTTPPLHDHPPHRPHRSPTTTDRPSLHTHSILPRHTAPHTPTQHPSHRPSIPVSSLPPCMFHSFRGAPGQLPV